MQRLTALERERDGLRSQLGDVRARLEESQAAHGQLEQQFDELREAAATATDLARRNLFAVGDRVRELNGALGAIEQVGGPLEPDPRARICRASRLRLATLAKAGVSRRWHRTVLPPNR